MSILKGKHEAARRLQESREKRKVGQEFGRVPTVEARRGGKGKGKEKKGIKEVLRTLGIMNRNKSFQRTGKTTAKERMNVQSKKGQEGRLGNFLEVDDFSMHDRVLARERVGRSGEWYTG